MVRLVWIANLAFFLLAGYTTANEIEDQRPNYSVYWNGPKPRLNPEQHGASIYDADVDADGRFLVTGSHDKTAKVWKIPQSAGEAPKLLRTLRPPIGDGDVGKINAVAITPNGNLVAIGGWLGAYKDSSKDLVDAEVVYIFDRQTGRMKTRIDGVKSRVNDLAFSPNGKLLVAALKFGNGLQMWDVENGALRASDETFETDSYGIAFDTMSGRFAATAIDGTVRLYASNPSGPILSPYLIAPTLDGKEPYGVSFSPDGEKIAIGYYDQPAITVMSTRDGSKLFSPDTTGISNGSLIHVSWSPDGKYVFAGGDWYNETSQQMGVRRWVTSDPKAYKDFFVNSSDTIVSVLPLGGDGFIYASTQPAFGGTDNVGKRFFDLLHDGRDLRSGETAWINIDNAARRLGLPANPYTEEQSVEFDVSQRILRVVEQVDIANLLHPTTHSDQFELKKWFGDFPELNGQPLLLNPDETSYSFAVAPGGENFLLGTNWRVRYFDKHGEQVWEEPSPDAAWRANISGDKRLAVVAYGDGTIRWYNTSNSEAKADKGRELLALFIHKDNRRWVMWTPEGYYDASPGGDELVGWHVNQSNNQEALFYNVSRFSDIFYRPDIVARALDGDLSLKPEAAPPVESFRSLFPPVIRILGIEKQSEGNPLIRYEVTSPNGSPIEEIQLMIDGDLQRTEMMEGDSRASGGGLLELICSEEDREIILSTKTNGGVFSETEAAEIVEFCTTPREKPEKKLFALVVGVSDYANDNVKDLKFADDDANAVAKILRAQKETAFYADVEVEALTNEKATRANILNALQWLTEKPSDKDVSLVYVAGHGQNLKRPKQKDGEIPTGPYYFLSHDADKGQLPATGVGIGAFENYARYAHGRKLLFFDTCYAGNVDTNGLLNDLAADELGTIVYASSTGKQLSKEGIGSENGVFTHAFLQAVYGDADSLRHPDGLISHSELALFLEEELDHITNGVQTPVHRTSKALSKTNLAAVVGQSDEMIAKD